MASVSFQNIEKAFGSTKVIHGVGFDIHDGEFMVLVGPSGCGKSTLRSEEHTSELQSRRDLVCRLLLEKKKRKMNANNKYTSLVEMILMAKNRILWSPSTDH